MLTRKTAFEALSFTEIVFVLGTGVLNFHTSSQRAVFTVNLNDIWNQLNISDTIYRKCFSHFGSLLVDHWYKKQ